jgi:hypothetical protein
MKRSRYTVTMQSGVKHVVLAYSLQEARTFYERRGYSVTNVTKGDFRKTAQRAAQSSSGAKHVPAAVAEAIDFLGITLPVDIRYSSHSGGVYGRHSAYPTGAGIRVSGNRVFGLREHTAETATFRHRILLKSWLSADQMGRTLWHELAHAMQFERDHYIGQEDRNASAVMRAYHASYRDGTAYLHKPAEVEARSYEPFNDETPLAR